MAYSDFTLATVQKTFELEMSQRTDRFLPIEAVDVSDHLKETLADSVPLAVAIHTEKARSEFIIAPILIELRRLSDYQVSLFSGTDFNVEASQGLNGVCDFIIGKSADQLILKTPVIAVVEAKNENIKGGLGQCIAEMTAAQRFNAQEGNSIEFVYGAVTTGTAWMFLSLRDQEVSIDLREYYIDDVGKILGILLSMLR